MKKLVFTLMIFLASHTCQASPQHFPLDYTKLVILDAEDLAEGGLNDAYEKLKPSLQLYVRKPARLHENFDSAVQSYSVTCNGVTYVIYAPSLPSAQAESWGRATVALFSIVNHQLRTSPVKFYAINSGNDLGGMFLTKQQVVAAKKSLKRKIDWPYIPTLEHPWYGQYH